MYLLNTSSLELEEFQSDIPPYAILSHRWRDEEVTFKDVELQRHRSKKGFAKVNRCCEVAAGRGLAYVWIDNCCIDKSSSAELSEAINSMYRWYQDAKECYAYLYDVEPTSAPSDSTDSAFASSVWFQRGFTLQELIAPKEVYFFNTHWVPLGQKSLMVTLLHDITGIAAPVLRRSRVPFQYSIAERLSWAASRKTTRVEDEAYSLLGILDVNMPLLYGEGKKAFSRLQEEIIRQSDDQTIFAWSDRSSRKPILAPSASCFQGLDHLFPVYPADDNRIGYTLANSGLSIQAKLIPWALNVYLVPLACGSRRELDLHGKIQIYLRVCIFVEKLQNPGHFVRMAYDGRDTAEVNSLELEDIANKFQLPSQRIFLHQRGLHTIRDVRQQSGIQLDFRPSESSAELRRTASDAKMPLPHDMVCHPPTLGTPSCTFEASSPLVHAVGALRLGSPDSTEPDRGLFRQRSRKKRQTFMYFAFTLDFSPICVITDEVPDALSPEARARVRNDDLSLLGQDEVRRMLDLKFVLSEFDKACREGGRGRALEGTVEGNNLLVNRELGVKMSFSLRPGGYGMDVWTATFLDL